TSADRSLALIVACIGLATKVRDRRGDEQDDAPMGFERAFIRGMTASPTSRHERFAHRCSARAMTVRPCCSPRGAARALLLGEGCLALRRGFGPVHLRHVLPRPAVD